MKHLLLHVFQLVCLLLTVFNLIAKPHLVVAACPSTNAFATTSLCRGTLDFSNSFKQNAIVTCNFSVLLEGAYDLSTGNMKTTLRQAGRIPNQQPYNHSNWNYLGQEQIASLPTGMVDWVLLSFRESLSSGCITRKAAVLLDDGTIEPFDIDIPSNLSAVFVMVEHRNHLPVITDQPIPITNGVLTFDFTQTEGYTGIGSGQKQLGNKWGLIAGNGDQNSRTGYDLNALDIAFWNPVNGTFNVYNPADYNMDNDVSANDRVLWGANNGIFSGIPKLNCSIPDELQTLTLTCIFEENFDAQPDFSNPTNNFYCRVGAGPGCTVMPTGWSDFTVSNERFHPIEQNDPSLEPNLQINSTQARGSSGKSLLLYDESFGNSGQWGSDVMLAKKLDTGYSDLYVEMWIKFQPGYRWHLVELGNGQNSAKILRIGHREPGQDGLSFGANRYNGPMAFINAMIWAQTSTGSNRAVLKASPRCDPQQTDYFCPDYNGGNIQGFLNNQGTFAQTFGDGNWHKIGARMKLNSSPGVHDGIMMLFYDDELVVSVNDIPWRAIGSPAGTLLNSVIIGGNMHNYPEPEANMFEQWYAIDDVKIYSIQ